MGAIIAKEKAYAHNVGFWYFILQNKNNRFGQLARIHSARSNPALQQLRELPRIYGSGPLA